MSNKTDRTIASIMSKNVVTCRASQNIAEAARLLVDNRIGALPVVDEMGVCVGILTATDIVRFEIERLANDQADNFGLEATFDQDSQGTWNIGIEPLAQVSRFMNRAVQTVESSSSADLAASIMKHECIHHLVVLDDSQRPIGMVSSIDLIG